MLFQSFARSQGKQKGKMAQEVSTQWIFLLPPISFGESIVLAEAAQQKNAFAEF